MPTIKDVAREAGVSIATVSYVLNNKPNMVSEETRQHVLDTARELGYRINITARNLKTNRTGLIGYAWYNSPADNPNWVMADFMYHLAQAVEGGGYHMLTFTHPSGDPISVYQNLIRSGRIDGFILAETIENDPRVHYLMQQDIPFVTFGRSNANWLHSWVDTDGHKGMHLAVEYLAEIGHTRIAFMGWPPDSLSGNHRLNGYLEGMQDCGLTVEKRFIIRSPYTNGEIDRILAHWYQLPPDNRPTAVIAIADYLAIAIIRAAEHHGFVIGDTLSVVGFDGAPIGQFIQPALTTLQQPMDVISNRLMEQFQSVFMDKRQVQTHLVIPQLVIRDSSGPPPTG